MTKNDIFSKGVLTAKCFQQVLELEPQEALVLLSYLNFHPAFKIVNNFKFILTFLITSFVFFKFFRVEIKFIKKKR